MTSERDNVEPIKFDGILQLFDQLLANFIEMLIIKIRLIESAKCVRKRNSENGNKEIPLKTRPVWRMLFVLLIERHKEAAFNVHIFKHLLALRHL